MQDVLKIGLIVKPQGVRGEVKIQPLTDDITRFKKLKTVLIDGKTFNVEGVTLAGNTVFLALTGICDRDVAESLRGKFVCVTRENAVKLPKDEYFIADVIGCKLFAEEELIGEVVDVTSSRTDVFTVKCVSDKIMRFPFLKDLIIKVDVEQKKITVKAKRLGEVSCYED
jgi:16S rRNA processing protein RimM